MAADQAAGLRRRRMRQPVSCIHCIAESTDFSTQLAQALHELGRESLLVDLQGRLFADATTRSLFDWKRQLERGQLQTLPQAFGKGWYAPGMGADEPALSGMASEYDQVIFDSGWRNTDLALLPGATHSVVLEVRRTDDSMRHAYALLKTLACMGSAANVGLLGDSFACDRVRAAAWRFLEQRFAHTIFSVANEDDAFAALAVRMANEETSLAAC